MIIDSESRWVGGRCTSVEIYFFILILKFSYNDDKEETTKQNKEQNKPRTYRNFNKYFFYLKKNQQSLRDVL